VAASRIKQSGDCMQTEGRAIIYNTTVFGLTELLIS